MIDEDGETLSRRALMRAAAGSALAASAGAASAQETETATPTGTGTSTGSGGGGGGGGATWTVEMTDENVYEPAERQVRPGDTVVWENVGSSGHTVTAYGDQIPDGANYWASGGFGSEEEARNGYPDQGVIDGGGTFEHTFQTEGTHGYFCIPHEGTGMKGTIEVTTDAPTPTPTPDPAAPALPPTAKAIGVAAAAAMASTLGLAYAFLKYGGRGGEQ
jgi:plastocyanin